MYVDANMQRTDKYARPDYKQITNYLNEYQDLWWAISYVGGALPCMDASMDLIDEPEYYGVDFSCEKAVYSLFFTGSSNYFPGIHVINDDKITESPIYIFDLASSDNDSVSPVGNFKTYISMILNDFINEKPDLREYLNNNDEEKDPQKYYDDAIQALKELDQFSDILCRPEEYRIKLSTIPLAHRIVNHTYQLIIYSHH